MCAFSVTRNNIYLLVSFKVTWMPRSEQMSSAQRRQASYTSFSSISKVLLCTIFSRVSFLIFRNAPDSKVKEAVLSISSRHVSCSCSSSISIACKKKRQCRDILEDCSFLDRPIQKKATYRPTMQSWNIKFLKISKKAQYKRRFSFSPIHQLAVVEIQLHSDEMRGCDSKDTEQPMKLSRHGNIVKNDCSVKSHLFQNEADIAGIHLLVQELVAQSLKSRQHVLLGAVQNGQNILSCQRWLFVVNVTETSQNSDTCFWNRIWSIWCIHSLLPSMGWVLCCAFFAWKNTEICWLNLFCQTKQPNVGANRHLPQIFVLEESKARIMRPESSGKRPRHWKPSTDIPRSSFFPQLPKNFGFGIQSLGQDPFRNNLVFGFGRPGQKSLICVWKLSERLFLNSFVLRLQQCLPEHLHEDIFVQILNPNNVSFVFDGSSEHGTEDGTSGNQHVFVRRDWICFLHKHQKTSDFCLLKLFIVSCEVFCSENDKGVKFLLNRFYLRTKTEGDVTEELVFQHVLVALQNWFVQLPVFSCYQRHFTCTVDDHAKNTGNKGNKF